MTLKTQLVDIKFDQGIDNREDGFLITGTFEKLVNMVRNKAGGFEKRYGFGEIPQTGLNGTPLKINEVGGTLACITDAGIYTYSTTTLSWTRVGDGPTHFMEAVSQLIPNDEIPVGCGTTNGKNVVITYKFYTLITAGRPTYSAYLNVLSSDYKKIVSKTNISNGVDYGDLFILQGATTVETSNGRLVLSTMTNNTTPMIISIYGDTIEGFKKAGVGFKLKSTCVYGHSVYMALAGQSSTNVVIDLVQFDVLGGNPVIANTANYTKGAGSIDDELINLSSSASSLHYCLADTVKGASGAFTTSTISGGISVSASSTTGNATVEADNIKLFTTATPGTAVTITSSVSSTGSGGRLNILVNGTIFYQKVISGRTTIIGYYRCSIGWVEFATSWQPGSNVLTPVYITSINTVGGGVGNTYSMTSATASLGSVTRTAIAGVAIGGPNLVDRSFISTNSFYLLTPVSDTYTRKLVFDVTSFAWSYETFYQAAICSGVNESFEALFFDKITLSVACINVLTKKLCMIINQGISKDVSAGIPIDYETVYKCQSFLSNAGLIYSPIESDNNFFGPFVFTKKSLITSAELQTIQCTKEVYFSGGYLGQFSEYEASEVGFFQSPRIETYASASTGGGMSEGAYQYAFVYSFVSSTGNLSESAPTFSTTITHASGSTNQVSFSLAPLAITNRDLTKCYLDIYRTEANGSIFYKLNSIQMSNQELLQFFDINPDSALLEKKSLYTTGGILPNNAIGACHALCATKNRVFAASSEDDTKAFFSKEKLTGYEFEFSGLQYIDCNGGQFEGSIKSLSGLDEKIIIAKDRYLLGIYGDGPNAAGGGQDFSIPQLISTDVGVSDKNSVVTMPNGLMFKTSKGIYLLDRKLQVSYIGILVDSYAGSTVNCSLMAVKKSQVFFGIAGFILVYDYLFSNWYTWVGKTDVIDGISMCIFNDTLVSINSLGKIIQQNATYADKSANIITEIETSWLEAGSIQGFQRLKRILFLGHGFGAASYDIKISTNYDPTVLETHVLPITETAGAKVQSMLHVANQKNETVKINIKESGDGTANKTALSGMTFQLGLKAGTHKLPASKKF